MNDDRIARLERLARLRDESVLSQAEFDAEKARVLNSPDRSPPLEVEVDPITAPNGARTPALTKVWLLAGAGFLVLIAMALVAIFVWGRDGADGPVIADEDRQAPVAAGPPTVAETEVPAVLRAEPEPVGAVARIGSVQPNITNEWRYLRTRIREGWGTEPTFANRYVIIRIGCGTGCTGNIVGDHRTGDLYTLGLGGEGYDQLQLRFDNASNLLTARWGEIESQTCVTQRYRWVGTELLEEGSRQTSPRVDFGCDEMPS